MSYPQPKSSISVLNSQDYFRLYTELESNGDIYEIDTSVKGLVIGPNSDIQTARIHYLERQGAGHIEQLLVGVSDPMLGRLDARMDLEYPLLGTPARILVTSDDLVPHPDQLAAFAGFGNYDADPGDYTVLNRPFIDLLGYHADPPAVPIARCERQWSYRLRITPRGQDDGVSWYFFPHYRRKYFHARFNCTIAVVGAVSARIFGVTLFPTIDAVPNMAGRLEAGPLNLPVAPGDTDALVVYADRNDVALPSDPHGYFDYMCVMIAGPELALGEISMDIISSDWA